MEKMNGKTDESQPRLMDLLNRALRLEYSLIVYYPRIAHMIKDKETRELALSLGSASIGHADVVANTITQLGGMPDWFIEPYPDHMDTKMIFQTQLEKEKQALQLHRESANLISPGSLGDALNNLANEEEGHIQIVQSILSRLNQVMESAQENF